MTARERRDRGKACLMFATGSMAQLVLLGVQLASPSWWAVALSSALWVALFVMWAYIADAYLKDEAKKETKEEPA